MKSYRLADVIRIKHGYAFSGEYIRDNDNDNGIVLVTPGNFKIGGGFQEDKCKFYTGDIPNEYILKGGDLVVTMTDLSKMIDTLGYSAYIPLSSRIYLHNQRIGLVTLISDEFDKDYVYWLMRTKYYQRKIANSSTGATVHHTSPSKIYDFKFDAPDINVQKKISSILTSYEELIENNNKRIKILEKMAENLYKEWFVRFRFPGYETAEFVDGMPNGWYRVPLKQLGEIVTGKTPSMEVEDNFGDEILFVKTPDMHGNMFVSDTGEKLSNKGHMTQPKKMIPELSLMVSCIGTGGIVSINTKKCHTNQQINSIILKHKFYLEWAYFTCCGLREIIEMFGATGTTMTNLSKGKFEKLKILMPDDEVICSFHEVAKPIFENILRLQELNQNLIKQRDYLLPRLMSGKLQVK